MLTELCQELRNWFDRERKNGTFIISGGALTADFLQEGQYFRIIGSVFNDGVHKYGDETDTLKDETFIGAVWALGIPDEVVELEEDIQAWRTAYEATDSQAMSPFQSESFGGYSYSKSASATSGNGAGGASWRNAFKSRLNMWRKILP